MAKRCRKILTLLALVAAFQANPIAIPEANAQCPMCRMAAESNLKDGGTAGKGLNRGILYMLAMPYLLVGTFGIIWWKNRRREEDFMVKG